MSRSSHTPRVTVYVPTYNRARLLPSTLASLSAQTFEDVAIVVVDNASTDDTPAVVEGHRDDRVSYVRQPRNLGILGNHKWILANASSEYALIIPDDDIAYPELLATCVRVLDENPRAGMVHTAFDVIDEAGAVVLHDEDWTHGLTASESEDSETFIRRSMLHSCRVCASTALMRAEAVPTGGMREADFPAIDLGMWLRMAAGGWSFAFVDATLGAYRIHGASHSAAFGRPSGAGYLNEMSMLDRLASVKRSFVEEYVTDPKAAAALKRLVRRSTRLELVRRVRTSVPDRRRVSTFRGLATAAALSPSVVVEREAWRLAAGSVLGPRVVDRIVRSGTRPPADREFTQ
jgi:glycosyltransferase involved in cell wall biosynthesis